MSATQEADLCEFQRSFMVYIPEFCTDASQSPESDEEGGYMQPRPQPQSTTTTYPGFIGVAFLVHLQECVGSGPIIRSNKSASMLVW